MAEHSSSSHTPSTIPRWAFVLCLLISAVGIFDHEAWTPDEPRVTAIALEMSRTGNVIVPHIASRPFGEKPPLYFAVAAAFIRVLGKFPTYAATVRLTSALWGLGVLGMTFLLIRRLANHRTAVLATVLLATTYGFVEMTHWVLVDPALVFFVMGALWSFAEAYLACRPWMLPAAGAFLAGAFLTKGFVGPVTVFFGWLGLALPWAGSIPRRRGADVGETSFLSEYWVMQHVLALALFAVPAAAWMALFRAMGGEALWRIWFWESHFGRLAGAAHLGHVKSNMPFYYVKSVLTFGFPWSPLVFAWFAVAVRDLWRRQAPTPMRLFVLFWALGNLLLLSAAGTKRDIYVWPLLPAFAFMAAEFLVSRRSRWINGYLALCWGLCLVGLSALGLSPLLASATHDFSSHEIAARAVAFFGSLSLVNVLAFAGAAGCALVVWKGRARPLYLRLIPALAISYICAIQLLCPLVDRQKRHAEGYKTFVAALPKGARERAAGWALSETMRAGFYLYTDWAIPLVQKPIRVHRIWKARDPEFDSLVFAGKPDYLEERGCMKYPYSIEVPLGDKRIIRWAPNRTMRKRKPITMTANPAPTTGPQIGTHRHNEKADR